MTCQHVTTYRHSKSVCLRCGEIWEDRRGLPAGTFAINGEAVRGSDVQDNYVCPECRGGILHRVRDGELVLECGKCGLDIAQAGKAIHRKRDAMDQSVTGTVINHIEANQIPSKALKAVLDLMKKGS